MPNEKPRGKEGDIARYYENHRDDPDEWEETGEPVTPKSTGMTVYSLRLPSAELSVLKANADARGTTVSDLIRNAIRNYLTYRASGALSYGQVSNVRVTMASSEWRGGSSAPSEIRPVPNVPVLIRAAN
jgi:Ribbon-helix-helix protein, copG family